MFNARSGIRCGLAGLRVWHTVADDGVTRLPVSFNYTCGVEQEQNPKKLCCDYLLSFRFMPPQVNDPRRGTTRSVDNG